MAKLTSQQITDAIEAMYGWQYVENSLKKTFKTKGFPQTMGFISAVGALCQAQDHHPDYGTFKYQEVALSFSTHSEGGVTQKDLDIAKAIDEIFDNGL
ncbi:MAG TPA: 4a-hydroxytetrahydrobiopterin dehydratase [Ignavibacteria bacterium]|nr:4a-hydroxytetrahydrobiopterin dehydratase [Ignavibacteria bacterium]